MLELVRHSRFVRSGIHPLSVALFVGGLLVACPPTSADDWEWFLSQHPAAPTGAVGESAPLTSNLNRPRLADGYVFTLSADEKWLATVQDGEFWLRHQPTGREWTAPLPGGARRVPPNLFTQQSDIVVVAAHGAFLDPQMERLRFAPMQRDPQLVQLADTFLAYRPGRNAADGQSARLGAGSVAIVEDAESGFVDLRFETVENGQRRRRVRGVDVGEVLEERQETLDALRLSFQEDLLGAGDEASGDEGLGDPGLADAETFAMEVLERFLQADAGVVSLQLDNLVASPDEEWLAATLTVDYPSFDGGENVTYGVLIPLTRGGLLAIPFARNVVGRAIWRPDSEGLYYLARDRVFRLDLDDRRFPGDLPEIDPSPSDGSSNGVTPPAGSLPRGLRGR